MITARMLVATLAIGAVAQTAAAQRSIVGFTTGSIVEQRVRLDGEIERVAGPVWGAGAAVRMSDWLSLRGRLASGTLSAQTPGAETRSTAEGELTVILVPDRWIVVDIGTVVRTMETSLARQRWIELRTGVELGADIIDRSLRGTVQLSIAPSVSVSGQPSPDIALGGGTGLEYTAGRLSTGLRYSFDRYDFPGNTNGRRLEQRSTLMARVGWRIR